MIAQMLIGYNILFDATVIFRKLCISVSIFFRILSYFYMRLMVRMSCLHLARACASSPDTLQTTGPVRASTFYLSLARTDHLDICRAIRFQIVLARTMTNHSMYFSHGRPPHISAVFAQSFLLQRDASMARVGVGHVNQTH